VLNQVAGGVWVRQRERGLSNAVAVRGLILAGPGIDGSGLKQFAGDLGRLGVPAAAGSPPVPAGTACSGIPG
jgi:hypothetical protein